MILFLPSEKCDNRVRVLAIVLILFIVVVLTLVVLAPLSSIKTMKITSDTTITASEGELEVRMGKGMTSVYVKKQEKLVLYTNEVSTLIQLLQTANTKLNEVKVQ